MKLNNNYNSSVCSSYAATPSVSSTADSLLERLAEQTLYYTVRPEVPQQPYDRSRHSNRVHRNGRYDLLRDSRLEKQCA